MEKKLAKALEDNGLTLEREIGFWTLYDIVSTLYHESGVCGEYFYYEMNELDDYLSCCTPTQIINMVDSEFDTDDSWFNVDEVWGDLNSLTDEQYANELTENGIEILCYLIDCWEEVDGYHLVKDSNCDYTEELLEVLEQFI